jgi:hypothetical protein
MGFLVCCGCKMLYGQTRTDGSRVAYSRTTRHQLSKRLSSLLKTATPEVGFVSALHNSCMLLSSTNALLLNSQSDAPELPAFPVPPSLIGDSSLRSLSYTTGIRALEEGLLSAGMYYDAFSKPAASRVEASQAASRGRTSLASAAAAPVVVRSASATAEEVTAAWSCLGRLYDAVNDNEVNLLRFVDVRPHDSKMCMCCDPSGLCWVFQMFQSLVEQSSVVSGTRDALEAELRGELEASLRLYDTMLAQNDEGVAFEGGTPQYEPRRSSRAAVQLLVVTDGWVCRAFREEEVRLWETRRMDCLVELGRWDVLCDTFAPDLKDLMTPEHRWARVSCDR